MQLQTTSAEMRLVILADAAVEGVLSHSPEQRIDKLMAAVIGLVETFAMNPDARAVDAAKRDK